MARYRMIDADFSGMVVVPDAEGTIEITEIIEGIPYRRSNITEGGREIEVHTPNPDYDWENDSDSGEFLSCDIAIYDTEDKYGEEFDPTAFLGHA